MKGKALSRIFPRIRALQEGRLLKRAALILLLIAIVALAIALIRYFVDLERFGAWASIR